MSKSSAETLQFTNFRYLKSQTMFFMDRRIEQISGCSPSQRLPWKCGANLGQFDPISGGHGSDNQQICLSRDHSRFSHRAVSYTHLRAHETLRYLVCRLLLEKNDFTPESVFFWGGWAIQYLNESCQQSYLCR